MIKPRTNIFHFQSLNQKELRKVGSKTDEQKNPKTEKQTNETGIYIYISTNKTRFKISASEKIDKVIL